MTEFTPTAAGVMAQIIAILLLATAFNREYRGILGTRVIQDTDGKFHSVPRNSAATRAAARWVMLTYLLALIVLLVDGWVVITGNPVTGAFAGIIGAANLAALAAPVGTFVVAILYHYKEAPDDREQDSQEQRKLE